MRLKRSNVVQFDRKPSKIPPPVPTHCVGRIVACSRKTGLCVDYPNNPRGPISASTVVRLTKAEVEEAIRTKAPVLLAFDQAAPQRAVIVGLVAPEPLFDAPDSSCPPPVEPHPEQGSISAFVDGREVTLVGAERVELRCGKASIVLTKAGKILIRGTYVSTHSTGAHRIKGGSVEIN